MATTSSWVAHASREPNAGMIRALHEWIDDSVRLAAATPGSCPFLADAVFAGIVAHTDRALHKRRQRPTFLSSHPCGLQSLAAHGLRPMCDVIDHDEFGPEELLVEHTGGTSTLAEAIASAAGADMSAFVPVFTESEFMDADLFHLHNAQLLNPRHGGVVIPFMIVPVGDSEQETQDREDIVRAMGFTSYTFECDWDDFTLEDHTRLALLMEDVLDEIVQIKSDAEARLLSRPPLWPLVEMRASPGEGFR
ncbi:hypothetical protein [Demequina sp.]|uniref:hypothetical protein n=1 Tax=Demequina sp. TaxID=2050685 RepID=UPI0025C27428|nr:hypothetical protein [Demequina sp.]